MDFLHLSEISFWLTSLPVAVGSDDITVVANTKQRDKGKDTLPAPSFTALISSQDSSWCEESDRSTGVTFEKKDLKVTVACASGYTEVEQILLEEELPIDQMQGQERSAGSSPCGSLKAVCRKRLFAGKRSYGVVNFQ